MVVVAGGVCSHIGTVSQAVPAAMSQVVRRHMKTRLQLRRLAGGYVAGNSAAHENQA